MIREELEFRIARYADGTLPAAQRAAVEAEVAADGAARLVLAEYQALRRLVDQAALPPLPAVRWERLTLHLSAAVEAVARGEAVHPGFVDQAAPPGSAALPGELDEQTEFAIACYADGSLEPARRAPVEALIASDRRARALLDEYENLDATAKAAAYSAPFALPAGLTGASSFGRLARDLDVAAAAGGAATALGEGLERQVADYALGAASLDERAAVEALLASDPAARIALSEYQNLDAALAALPAAAPLPSVDWDRLAGQISGALDEAVPAVAGTLKGLDAAGSGVQRKGRRGLETPTSFPIWSWLRSPARLAAAASVLIAAGLGARLLRNKPQVGPEAGPASVALADVATLQVESPAQAGGSAVEDVQIGPPKEVADADAGDDAGEGGVVSSPPRAFVASGLPAPREADVLPAMPF